MIPTESDFFKKKNIFPRLVINPVVDNKDHNENLNLLIRDLEISKEELDFIKSDEENNPHSNKMLVSICVKQQEYIHKLMAIMNNLLNVIDRKISP